MKRFSGITLSLLFMTLVVGCETSEPIIDHLESTQPAMPYSVAEVSDIRTAHNVDQRAMAIDGVISVGISGKSNDDAWIEILCRDTTVIADVKAELGDSLAGVPINFSISDPIQAQ